ncbi:calmodulin-binding protein 60 D-like isoform X2 [Eucalyptus grandis]|uniref:calmodulin-binding protein 60 D-like isoform X2 n=1 Tax=Eucalyptus grandis TaxID=71139 RepID=UPI00192EE6C9|nr:calmodulin-binding protein 60 D-like isoform X2 [Eucalyptus grandis]
MGKPKRALPPSSSSGQPSQPKRPCVPPIDQAWNGPEMNPVPSCCLTCCLTKEDLRSMFKEELESAKSDWAEYFQSCIWNALKDLVPQMRSENDFQRLMEAVELGNIHSPQRARANANSTGENDVRDLRLQIQTKLSDSLFTGQKLEGVGGAHISIALINANTGDVVRSGLESSIKLDIVVLEGDFNKDDEDNWTQEEFESHVVKQREGKRPLLAGDLVVKLKEGVGEIGELMFTDNSSWNRSKRFRIGLKVATGFCGNTRIREAKTDAFQVKENRGEAYMKHHPPASDDEVWRLENIAKGGKSHQKLSDAGIYKVEDFLLQLFTDPEKLREILGKSITEKKWDSLIRHAKTCETKWKLYLDYPDGVTKHGAVFNTDGQPIGLVKDTEYFATHRLSAQEKEHGDAIVKKALANWNDVREFNGETFSDSMRRNPVQRYLAPPIFPAPFGLEAPPANVSSTAEGLNGATALVLPFQSPNFPPAAHQPMSADRSNVQIPPGFHDSTSAGLPTQPLGINVQNAIRRQMIGSSSPMDNGGYDNVLLEGDHVMEEIQSIDLDAFEKWFAESTPCNDPLSDNGFVRGTGRGVIGWLKIKAVLQWGYFIRKTGVRLVELDQPTIEVRACS